MREIKFRAWHKIDNSMIDWKELCLNGFGAYAQNFFSRSDLTLMQYTGLKDKNGKEIYEGDIVYMYLKNTVINWTDYKYNINKEEANLIEVIGNICENKDLLQ